MKYLKNWNLFCVSHQDWISEHKRSFKYWKDSIHVDWPASGIHMLWAHAEMAETPDFKLHQRNFGVSQIHLWLRNSFIYRDIRTNVGQETTQIDAQQPTRDTSDLKWNIAFAPSARQSDSDSEQPDYLIGTGHHANVSRRECIVACFLWAFKVDPWEPSLTPYPDQTSFHGRWCWNRCRSTFSTLLGRRWSSSFPRLWTCSAGRKLGSRNAAYATESSPTSTS